jgi:hypothetical protein
MKRSKGMILLFVVLLVSGTLFLSTNSSMAAEKPSVKLVFPALNVKSGVAYSPVITAYNYNSFPVTFNRVALAYMHPDLLIKGPYEVSRTSRTVPAATGPNNPGSLPFSIPLTITSTQPSGTLVPVVISLWLNKYDPDGARGVGATGAKLIP